MLDLNLGNENSIKVAQKLKEIGVPFIFATGYGERAPIPADLGFGAGGSEALHAGSGRARARQIGARGQLANVQPDGVCSGLHTHADARRVLAQLSIKSANIAPFAASLRENLEGSINECPALCRSAAWVAVKRLAAAGWP